MDLQTIFAYGFILIFIITETWIKRKTKSNNENNSEDKGSRYIIIGSVVCCLLLMNEQLLPSIAQLPHFLIYIGILLSLAGFVLRIYAVNYLGKNFTLAVQTTDSQQLVEAGPYSIVRNPAYTGSIVSILGLSIVDELVRLQDGRMTLESEVNVGTTITIVFPAIIEDAEDEESRFEQTKEFEEKNESTQFDI